MAQRLRLMRMLLLIPVSAFIACWGQVALGGGRHENVVVPDVVQSSPGTQAVLNLSEGEQAWLHEHPVIRMAQDPGWPPIEFTDEHGAFVGIATDYVKLLGQRLGITFVSVSSASWNESFKRLKNWDIDMTACLTETADRSRFLTFTKPYLSSPIVILTRSDVSYVGDMRDLSGKKVAVVEGYAVSEWIARDYPEIIQVKVSSVREGVERVDTGDAFALVDNMLVLSYYRAKSKQYNVKISGTSAYLYAQSMAVRKDWSIFAGILQKALDSISEPERFAIYKKWVPERFTPEFDYQLGWKVLSVVALILVGLLIWNRKLTSEIQKRKRVEAALSESEESYRKLFEDHAAVKMLIDPDSGAIVDANRAAADYYGWPREQLQRMNIRQINRSASDVLENSIKKTMAEHDAHFEFHHQLADGSIRDVEVFSSRVRWKDRDFLHSIVHDITDRKHVADELERLRAAIEQTSDGVVVGSVDGTILFVNPSFEVLAEMDHSELIGKNVSVLKNGLHDERIFGDIWATISGGNRWKGRFSYKKEDGSPCFVEATVSPVRDAADKIVNYVSVERDVTDHVNLSEQLQRAQRLESVGRLAGGVAHDFNNMLQIILGHVELALDLLGNEHAVSPDLISIQQATRGAAELTQQLLTFARKRTVSPQVLNLNTVVDGILESLIKTAGENVEFVWRPKKDLWSVKMDLVQVKQIFDNLCQNARDAIAGAGKIEISTDSVVFDRVSNAHYAGITAFGEYVAISVTDSGCGMGPDVMAHLFEPFYTTKKMGKGTGLGLATVYGIVNQNNGAIDVESSLGNGTTVTIYLPRHVGEAVPLNAGGVGVPEHGKGETLLVVEDETVILSIVKRNLEKLGYRVFSAELPKLALEIAEKHVGEIQLLVTDVVMPGMNGKELSVLLQARDPKMRVLFMSGYTADAMAHHGMLEAGIHFLQKPFTTVDLAKKVRQALDQS